MAFPLGPQFPLGDASFLQDAGQKGPVVGLAAPGFAPPTKFAYDWKAGL